MLVERGVLSLVERKSSYSLQNDFISTGGEHPSPSSSPFKKQRKEVVLIEKSLVCEN